MLTDIKKMGGCLKVTGCLAPRKKKRTQVASSHHLNVVKGTKNKEQTHDASRVPRKGIGRFTQTEEGSVLQSGELTVQGQERYQIGIFYDNDDPRGISYGIYACNFCFLILLS